MELKPGDTPNIRLAVPFFGVDDIDASLRFYVDGLGFALTRHWAPDGRIRWCWLELGAGRSDGFRLDFESPTDLPEGTRYTR
jgi:catechol 2,3-dioxygenase-like lactoylglutathione lyase family enzyme